MRSRLFIGLMSGTSVDGIDAALVRIISKGSARYGVQVVKHYELPWGAAIRKRLLAVMAPAETKTAEICELNVVVAERFAAAALEVIRRAKFKAGDIYAIGSHGQTICHLPPGRVVRGARASTLQIGDPSVIATATGIRTVGNFRPADMTVGGQGAPLVPWTDAAMLSHPKRTRCIQNIGGIANVTYLSPGREVIAFDTGPGNMLLDAVVSLCTNGKQRYDRNGRIAARGQVDPNLFRTLRGHPYFKKNPPKSTGREDFGRQLAEVLVENQRSRGGTVENLVHTVTRLTAWSIVEGYGRYLPTVPDEVILCGGGADNPTLVGMLREAFGEGKHRPTIGRIDDFGIPNKAKEATSFALLAAATLDGVPANLPSVTGARRSTILGVIAPGRRM